jgi:hypothetical protein
MVCGGFICKIDLTATQAKKRAREMKMIQKSAPSANYAQAGRFRVQPPTAARRYYRLKVAIWFSVPAQTAAGVLVSASVGFERAQGFLKQRETGCRRQLACGFHLRKAH